MLKQSIVHYHVPIEPNHDCRNYVKIKSIKQIEKADVFNMEVETHHNFLVNGGFVVHNCIDAIRYALEDDIRNVRVT